MSSGTISMSEKQHEIMSIVLRAADEGEFVDIDQLKTRLSYGAAVSKQAIQCSIRFLEQHGMVERAYESRRRNRRMIVKPTLQGFRSFRVGYRTLPEEISES